MAHSIVVQKWFNQLGTKENSFSSSNMFYTNKIIYSYGYHFAIAIRLENIVLFNLKTYSNSTSKHQHKTFHAIDKSTHKIVRAPLKNANRFNDMVTKKEVYKYIDFSYFVDRYNENITKLGNARKPEIYIANIEVIKNDLQNIFTAFRGAKTYAKQTKGINKVLNFTPTKK